MLTISSRFFTCMCHRRRVWQLDISQAATTSMSAVTDAPRRHGLAAFKHQGSNHRGSSGLSTALPTCTLTRLVMLTSRHSRLLPLFGIAVRTITVCSACT